jgi:transposase
MNALSLDLRRRAVDHYLAERAAGRGSYEATAALFKVGVASLDRWLQRKRETGDVLPRQAGGGRKSPIRLDWLVAHVDAHPDATLKQRAKAHQEVFGGKVPAESAMCEAMRRAGFTHKKRLPSPRSVKQSA